MKTIKKQILSILMAVTMVVAPIACDAGLAKVNAEEMVLVTRTGSKYHTQKCGNGTYYQVTLTEARNRGLTACSKCYSGGSSATNTQLASTSPSTQKTTPKQKKMSLNKKEYTLIVGGKVTLKAKNVKGKVKWSTKKKSIAKVSSKGVVKGVGKGTTYIIAKCGSQTVKCKIRVEKPGLNKKSITVEDGGTTEIKLNGCKHDIDWYSEDEEICDVSWDEGTNVAEIEACGAGTTNIVAKVLGKRYKCKVVVLPGEEETDEELDGDELDYLMY